jgi:hypothetical protein
LNSSSSNSKFGSDISEYKKEKRAMKNHVRVRSETLFTPKCVKKLKSNLVFIKNFERYNQYRFLSSSWGGSRVIHVMKRSVEKCRTCGIQEVILSLTQEVRRMVGIEKFEASPSLFTVVYSPPGQTLTTVSSEDYRCQHSCE